MPASLTPQSLPPRSPTMARYMLKRDAFPAVAIYVNLSHASFNQLGSSRVNMLGDRQMAVPGLKIISASLVLTFMAVVSAYLLAGLLPEFF
jgi:hypothetical protein